MSESLHAAIPLPDKERLLSVCKDNTLSLNSKRSFEEI
jgi:hypothetical protein